MKIRLFAPFAAAACFLIAINVFLPSKFSLEHEFNQIRAHPKEVVTTYLSLLLVSFVITHVSFWLSAVSLPHNKKLGAACVITTALVIMTFAAYLVSRIYYMT